MTIDLSLRRPRLWLLCLSIAVIAACAPSVPENSQAPAATQTTDPPATQDTTSIEVQPLDRAGYERFIQEHHGHVVLVDFWATWCPPCMEGFPDTVHLNHKYSKQGLVVGTMALEDLEHRAKVLEFLRQQQAHLPNFISAYGGTDGRAMDEFQLNSGTIPTLKLYDRQGNLSETFGDGLPFTVEQIEVAIRQLLASDSHTDRQGEVIGDD